MTGDVLFLCWPCQRGGALINTAVTKVSTDGAELKGDIDSFMLCIPEDGRCS